MTEDASTVGAPGPWDRPVLASISFRVTPADLAAGYRADLRWRYTRPQSAALPFLTAAALVGAGLTSHPDASALSLGLSAAVGLAAVGGMRLLVYMAAPLIARVSLQKRLGDLSRVELTAEGVRTLTPHQDVFTAWRDCVAWSEDRHVALLYTRDTLYQFIPLRAAPPGTIDQLHRLVGGLPRRLSPQE